jgi:transposase
MLVPAVRVIRCQPKTHPCPRCGKRGRRVRRLQRDIRSLAYQQEAWLDVRYAEYKSRCGCCKSFRSWPLGVPQKSDYDDKVRQAVLDRLLDDGLNVQRTLCAIKRDFLLEVSEGFVYDCLDWQLHRLNLPQQRRLALERFSGVLCIDELHLGKHTLLLATDPIADQIVGFALVKVNDQPHMRRFLLLLNYWGFLPSLVISDGSNLYPATLAEVWPAARHQLCIFHIVQDITKKVLDAVRRLRRLTARRGNAGRKPKRGRAKKGARKRPRRRGPTNREKAAYVFKRRYLIVKRLGKLSAQEHADLRQMFEYLPELRTLHQFMQEVYQLWSEDQSLAVARWRWWRLRDNPEYQQVPELAEVIEGLTGEKYEKTQAFLSQPAGKREKTNNHVERLNRKLRFLEKVRYKWRGGKSLLRWVILRVSRHTPKPKAPPDQPGQGPPGPSQRASATARAGP